jgi:hypothetical protein
MKMIIVMNHRPHSVYFCVIEIYFDDRWMRPENPDQPVSRYAVISFVLPANAHVLAIQAQGASGRRCAFGLFDAPRLPMSIRSNPDVSSLPTLL